MSSWSHLTNTFMDAEMVILWQQTSPVILIKTHPFILVKSILDWIVRDIHVLWNIEASCQYREQGYIAKHSKDEKKTYLKIYYK